MAITAKQTIKTIKQTVYETSDGTTFTDLEEANIYQSQFTFEELDLPTYTDISNPTNNIDYYIINSLEEFKIFETYYKDFREFCFTLIFELSEVQFPILVSYDGDGEIDVVSEEQYERHNQICEMYEKTIKEK
jgi:hypothetical protein